MASDDDDGHDGKEIEGDDSETPPEGSSGSVSSSTSNSDPNSMSLQLQCFSDKVPQFVTKLLMEAKTRWLKCAEVGDLLLNYKSYAFGLCTVPPNKPPGTC
jgi:hypothetical protein